MTTTKTTFWQLAVVFLRGGRIKYAGRQLKVHINAPLAAARHNPSKLGFCSRLAQTFLKMRLLAKLIATAKHQRGTRPTARPSLFCGFSHVKLVCYPLFFVNLYKEYTSLKSRELEELLCFQVMSWQQLFFLNTNHYLSVNCDKLFWW